MTGGFSSRRRADDFDALLATPASERDDAQVEQYAELLELVGSLRALPEVEARPEFVADLRSRLVVAAARQPAPRTDAATIARLTPRQRRGSGERKLATLLGGFAVVAATGSMAVASQGALPGEVLYPVKRAIENAETNLQSDDAARAEILLEHAEQRLREVETLAAQEAGATEIATTLQDFTDQTNQAASLSLDGFQDDGDTASVDRLRDFNGTSLRNLSSLGDRIPAEARPSLITAAKTVQQADQAAVNLCPTCGTGDLAQLPTFATQSATLPNLLGLEDTADSLTSAPDPGFVDDVEKQADHVPEQSPKQQRDRDRTDAGPGNTDDRGTDDRRDDTPRDRDDDKDGPDNVLDELGDGLKDRLGLGDKKSDSIPKKVVDTTTGVVNGVTGLVTGLLGP